MSEQLTDTRRTCLMISGQTSLDQSDVKVRALLHVIPIAVPVDAPKKALTDVDDTTTTGTRRDDPPRRWDTTVALAA